MRRQVQILCIAGAAVVAGGTLWAVAGSNMLERFGLSSPTPVVSNAPAPDQRVVAALTPKAAAVGAARRPVDALAIEIARIEAGGASVIAGRSAPNHRVSVLANGREIASAVASDEGQWSVIVSEGIAAGPLELSISSRPVSGGPAVISAPRHLVVPDTRAGSAPQARMAEAPPAKVWAPPMAASATTPKSAPKSAPPAKAASAPVARPPAEVQAQDRTVAADKRALEQFAALVERARTDAAAAAAGKGGSPNAGGPSAGSAGASAETARAPAALIPSATPPLTPGPLADRPAPAVPATVTAATMRAGATDALPDPAQVPIPVPITFVTDETELTPDGARAAALLAEYLRLKRPEGISLSGHADSRGPDGYNMELSQRRLEAIERYLRRAGYAGNLSLVPKGKREPYRGVDRTRLSMQEIYQADRRVELRLTP